MQVITRKLSKEEFVAWDELVISSPQAGLFHTTAWNQMICETASERQSCMYMVYEKDGNILGGIPLHSRYSDLAAPMFGYNGPFFHPNINYQEQYKTIPGYEVNSELLKNIRNMANRVVIKNQPEIWDMRAYSYNSWKIKTNYTHILPCLSQEDVWKKIAEPIQGKIIKDQYSIVTDITSSQIQEFCLHTLRELASTQLFPSRTMDNLLHCIHWMRERDVCQFSKLVNKSGDELAIALFILSRENRTAYLWKVFKLLNVTEIDILPSLIWQSYLLLGKEFERIDLGESTNMAVSNVKDQVGGLLTPFYIAKHQN